MTVQVGFGTLEEELMRVQSLRASPPGFAADDALRRRVFGAALHQFAELLTAAAHAGPASSPILLFYALSQAGRAIAAARCEDQRWDFRGHGLRVIDDKSSLGATRIKPVVSRDRSDAFSVVSDVVTSPPLTHDLTLSQLWASIPESESVEGLTDQAQPAVLLEPDGTSVAICALIEVPEVIRLPQSDWDTALAERFLRYPRVGVFEIRGQIHLNDRTALRIMFPAPDRRSYRLLDEVGEPVWSDEIRFLRPALNEAGNLPSTFMSWWLLLFAFAHYSRYVPGAWADTLARDSSALAIPIERSLATARRQMPRQVLHAITNRWDL